MYSKQSYVYKTVQNSRLHADVYRTEGIEQKPGIIWIPGGGMIFGCRTMLPLEQIELYLAAGYVVIAIDYRLAPETKLDGILEDMQEAYHWVHTKGPDLFGIDPDRLAIIGHSAGGYLALMMGFRIYPRPKALISFYGYGDITGEWSNRPSPHYINEPLVSPEIAYGAVGERALPNSAKQRWFFYLFCRQQGLWLKEITGYDPEAPDTLMPFCPVRNINQDYPPTLLLHGDQDVDVPFELSEQMALSLKEKQIPHRFIAIEGLGHMFDLKPQAKVVEAFNAVLTFLKEQV